ncbi:mechanosensitive ion channel family protein [Shigella flexneri]
MASSNRQEFLLSYAVNIVAAIAILIVGVTLARILSIARQPPDAGA